MKFRIFLGLFVIALFGAQAKADGIVTNGSSAGWIQVSPNTFALPADLTSIGCGTEFNSPSGAPQETTCEPNGVFNFNTGFTSTGVFNILDSTGAVSDQIQVSNDANGHGVITFIGFVDPAHLLPNGTTLCTENDDGCIGNFTLTGTNGTVFSISPASDGINFFDPFNLNLNDDTGDQIQINTVSTPEPGSLALLSSGLLGLAGMLLKKRE